MTSKLLNCDPKDVPPARAAAAFMAEVNRLVREQEMSLGDAWAQVKSLEPELLDRINQNKPHDATALTNDVPRAFPTAPPVGNNKVFHLAAMKLPPDTTDEEFSAAWKFNGGKSSPLNARDVFTGLVGHTAAKTNTAVKDARRTTIERFPALAKAAGQTVA